MSRLSLYNNLLRNKRAFPGVVLQPSFIGLVAWYKTESIPLTDGQAVDFWADDSVNGNNLVQATSGKRPTFKTNVLQGQNAVRFSATNDNCLINTTPTGFGSSGLTIYAVLKPINWATWGMVVVTNPTLTELRLTNTASVYGFIAAAGASSVLYNSSEGAGPWAARILRARFDNASNVLGIKVGGLVPETTNTDAGVFGSTQICLGARDNADTTLNLDADLGEVLIYNADIAGADKTQTEAYLQARWGLAP